METVQSFLKSMQHNLDQYTQMLHYGNCTVILIVNATQFGPVH